jgi:hypothetical protein
VAARGHEFGIGFVVNAKRDILSINATDITSNMAMLFSLYLASPIRRRVRVFLIGFICSLIVIFFVHTFTVIMLSREALSGHPGIMALSLFSKGEVRLAVLYNAFYNELGMYLVVLLLWFPYILWCVRGMRGPKDETSALPVSHSP